jgi:zinc/manganese transport system substrate-binding protein
MNIRLLFTLLPLCVAPLQATALELFTCEPEWAALASELGGDRVQVYSAVTGRQDVHVIQARPSLIAKIRTADLVVCTGADLESAWLPVLLRQGANPAVRPGSPGFLEAARHVPMLDRPENLDRAEGDLHPMGNPHIQLDPRNIARVAVVLSERLAKLDPSGAEYYDARGEDFRVRWENAIADWETRAAPLKGMPIVTQHRSWTYLVDWLGLNEVANLEPKPGIEPSTSHLASLLSIVEDAGVALIVRSSYQSSRAAEWLSRKTGIPAVVLPHTVGSMEGVDDLFAVFERILTQLTEAAE